MKKKLKCLFDGIHLVKDNTCFWFSCPFCGKRWSLEMLMSGLNK